MVLGDGMQTLGSAVLVAVRIVLRHDAVVMTELAVDPEPRRHELHVALLGVEMGLHLGRHHRHIGELLEKIEVPPGAAEFAVGRARKSDVLLQLHDLADALVLDAP